MSDVSDLKQLQERHDTLYQEILVKRCAESRLEDEIDRLLQDIKARAPLTTGLDDFLWLMNATMQWQWVYSTIIKKPKLITVPAQPGNLRTPPPPRYDIKSVIRQHADLISLFRRGKGPSTKAERDADWYQAQVYMSMEFLTGEMNLVREAFPGGHEVLENVWLKDVIQLKAYENWLKRGAPHRSTAEEARVDYYKACRLFRDMLEDQEIKRQYDKDEFSVISDYLFKYFEKDQRTLSKRGIEQLVEQKAQRYSRAHRKKTAEQNWIDAEWFVRKFYGNITRAIMDEDLVSISEVSDAIWWSEGEDSRMEIMNCFEAAICIYFLKSFKKAAGVWKTHGVE